MTSKIFCVLAFAAVAGLAGTAAADVWDTATINDNGPNTRNEITHGFSQVHDLAALPGPVADQDWYFIVQEPFSSYEILCDGFTGDDANGAADILQRVDNAGFVLQDSASHSYYLGSYARSLRFVNDTSANVLNQFVRVANATCGAFCDPEDLYRIRAWNTTIAVPRYNNFGGQVTVLIIQNPGQVSVSGNARLWVPGGGTIPITTVAFTVASRQTSVVNLATVNGGAANGFSGAITITNDGRYGQLAVKSVALEPSTGFSFDTPGLYRP
jgi:hypothetical protein